jgi:protein-disulfide isomerase
MKKPAIIFVFGLVALAAVFVLLSFASNILSDAVSETQNSYPAPFGTGSSLRTDGDFSQTSDLYVVEELGVASVLATDPVQGGTSYDLTIVEYGDFECSYCADLAPPLQQLLSQYPNIRLVWKDLPIPGHLQARPAANAARCAQVQGSFWPYHDLLFTNQTLLGSDLYMQIAQALDLNLTEFESCVENQVFDQLVTEAFADVEKYSITGTPYLFVGSTRVDQLVTLEQLQILVEQELTD